MSKALELVNRALIEPSDRALTEPCIKAVSKALELVNRALIEPSDRALTEPS